MSIKIKMLAHVSRRQVYFKGARVGFLDLSEFSYYTERTITSSFHALKNDGHIAVGKDGLLRITPDGQRHLRRASVRHRIFASPFGKDAIKNLLVIYQVPSEQKSQREWLRRQLKIFGFVMVYPSAWVGPSPLPLEFLAYTKEIGLKGTFKSFKLAKGYGENNGDPDRR